MNYDVYSQRRYIPELDGLRGISVILVVTHHLRDQVYWSWLMGQLGVTIFFVISGYLITTLGLREERQYGAVSLKAFFVRRCLRILPLYYLTLMLYGVLIFGGWVGEENRDAFWAAFPYYLTYLQELPTFFGSILINQGELTVPLSHSWSLGVEEKFYLIWPLVAFVLCRGATGKRQLAALFLAVAFGVAPLVRGQQWVQQHSVTASMIIGCLIPYSKILWGCLLGTLLEEQRSFEILQRMARTRQFVMTTIALVIVHLCLSYLKRWPLLFAYVEAIYIGLIGLFLIGLLVGEWRYRRIFAWGPLVFLGKRSYGIYLFHVIALNVVQRGIEMLAPDLIGTWRGSLLEFAVGGSLSVYIADIMYVRVELPLVGLGRSWSSRMVRPKAVDDRATIVLTS